MFIYDIVHKKNVCNIITNDLKNFGVKYRFKKNAFQANIKETYKNNSSCVFKTALSEQQLSVVNLLSGGVVYVPIFVKQATTFLEKHLTQEGLFRKAGSQIRQKELISYIDKGFPLGDKTNAIDVANLLKTFFRDLSEPLIPYMYHDLFVHCAMLKVHRIESILLACMFLPSRHIQTLAFFMEFLKKVSLHDKQNKMNTDNLAKVITPNIMPLQETTMLAVEKRLQLHLLIIKILIENAENIGVLPNHITQIICNDEANKNNEELETSDTEPHLKLKDKKHRSASLTRKPHLRTSNINLRMFSGLKKIVGKNGSSDVLNEKENQQNMKKTNSTHLSSSKLAKKRKVMELPDTLHVKKKKTPEQLEKNKKIRLSLDRFIPKNKQKSIDEHTEKMAYRERRWSSASNNGSKKFIASSLQVNPFEQNRISPYKIQDDYNDVLIDANVNLSDDNSELDFHANSNNDLINPNKNGNRNETKLKIRNTSNLHNDLQKSMIEVDDESREYVKVPKREYEEIKNRVSAIESRISEELDSIAMKRVHSSTIIPHSVNEVQTEYKKTLEESGIENTIKADNLAKRLGKELKIRRSCEHKIIRSPSARKIGTIRRRSQDKIISKRVVRRTSWDSVSQTFIQQNFYNDQLNSRIPDKKDFKMEFDSFCSNETNARLEYLQEQLKTLITHTAEHAGESFSDDSINLITNDSNQSNSKPINRTSSLRNNDPKNEYFNKKVEQLKRAKSQEHLSRKSVSTKSFNHGDKKNCIYSWKNADNYFKSQVQSPATTQTGRASITKLRTQNAGMVLATANLFDTNKIKLKSSVNDMTLQKCDINQDKKIKSDIKVRKRVESWSESESNKNKILHDPKVSQSSSLNKRVIPNGNTRNPSIKKSSKHYLKNLNNSINEDSNQRKKETSLLTNKSIKNNSLCRTPHIKKPLANTPLILKTPKNCKTLAKSDINVRNTPLKAVVNLETRNYN